MATLPEIVSKDFKNEFVKNVSDEQYHADKTAMGSTGLRMLAAPSTPAHFYSGYILGQAPKKSKELDFGKIAHMAFLEPEKFKTTFVKMPEFGDQRSPKNKEAKQKWLQEVPQDATIVSAEDLSKIDLILKNLYENKIVRGLIEKSEREFVGYFRETETGVKCKIKIDLLSKNKGLHLTDFKTSRSGTEYGFNRSVIEYRYDIQSALYAEGVNQILGNYPDSTSFIVIENNPPYLCSVFEVSPIWLDCGLEYKKLLKLYVECMNNNQWPGYPQEARLLTPPAWFVSGHQSYEEFE